MSDRFFSRCILYGCCCCCCCAQVTNTLNKLWSEDTASSIEIVQKFKKRLADDKDVIRQDPHSQASINRIARLQEANVQVRDKLMLIEADAQEIFNSVMRVFEIAYRCVRHDCDIAGGCCRACMVYLVALPFFGSLAFSRTIFGRALHGALTCCPSFSLLSCVCLLQWPQTKTFGATGRVFPQGRGARDGLCRTVSVQSGGSKCIKVAPAFFVVVVFVSFLFPRAYSRLTFDTPLALDCCSSHPAMWSTPTRILSSSFRTARHSSRR